MKNHQEDADSKGLPKRVHYALPENSIPRHLPMSTAAIPATQAPMARGFRFRTRPMLPAHAQGPKPCMVLAPVCLVLPVMGYFHPFMLPLLSGPFPFLTSRASAWPQTAGRQHSSLRFSWPAPPPQELLDRVPMLAARRRFMFDVQAAGKHYQLLALLKDWDTIRSYPDLIARVEQLFESEPHLAMAFKMLLPEAHRNNSSSSRSLSVRKEGSSMYRLATD